jgi:hypothetical protein
MKNLHGSAKIRNVVIGTLCAAGLVASYALAICWRVADAELRIFHRNHIFKTLNNGTPDYTGPVVPASYGGKTFQIVRSGRIVTVHKQLINGFQHVYGSGLAAFELGDFPADVAFRLVEYFEAYTTKGGRTYAHLLDTKKDLLNNSQGRKIAAAAHAKGLTGKSADDFMQDQILQAIDRGDVINHFMDYRVQNLPPLEAFGCWGLPHPKPDFSALQVVAQ